MVVVLMPLKLSFAVAHFDSQNNRKGQCLGVQEVHISWSLSQSLDAVLNGLRLN
jgi:hypothetical protein